VALDVAIQSAGFTAFTHFQSFSLVERTSPNEYFNAGEYLTAKAAQANAAAVGGRTDWTADGIALAIKDAGIATIWDHFAQFGWVEGVNPSNAFDVSDYFADKLAQLQAAEPAAGWTDASMKAAFAAAGLDPVTHYLSFGTTEGLSVTVVPEGEQVEGSTPSGEAPQTFTLTPDVDNILGAAGNDTVSGNSNTFNAGDVIDGGDGTDKLSLVLNESATAYAGVVISNIEAIELRSIASSAVDADAVVVSMSDVTGLETVSVVKSTGNTVIEDLQAGIDVIIDDVRGDVEIDFDNQNVPAAIDVSVNEFGESAGGMGMSTLTIDAGVDTVNISDDAADSNYWNGFNLDGGFSELNVTGGAADTRLDMDVESSASTLDANFSGNASEDKNIGIDMGAADQALTLTMGGASDDVVIYNTDSGDDVTATLGGGDNNLDVYGEGLDAFNVMAGAGDDSVTVDTWPGSVNSADLNLGEGDNYLHMDDVGSLYVTTGAGADIVETDDVGYADIAVGGGYDEVWLENFWWANINLGDGGSDAGVEDGDHLTVLAGEGDDYFWAGDVWWSDIDLGNGNNSLWMNDAEYATVVTGSGADYVGIDNNYWDTLNISVGGDDDWVYLGGGGLETSTNWWAGSDNHTVAGGDGADTLNVDYLWNANASGSFANVTSVETLATSVGWWWWGGVSFDGVTTGANAAGVSTYDLRYGNYYGTDIELTNVVNNVTVNMDLDWWDDQGQTFTLTQTPDDGANVANVHFDLYSWWGSNYFHGDITVDTTETLNLSGSDYWWWGADLEISGLYSADLTTLNLSGDLGFDFWNIVAPNLATVDASGMTAIADIELNDVADSVTVTGGSNDDTIILKDTASAMVAHGGAGGDYIEGNMNDDALNGDEGDDVLVPGAGIDSVYGGAGDDLILWDAAEMFAVDLVDGGADWDTVRMTGSLGTQNDSFFYQWNDVERLDLGYDGVTGNNLTLGIIASDAGLQEIHMNGWWWTASDTIILEEGFTNDMAIYMSDSGDDTIVDQLDEAHAIDLRVYALANDVEWWDNVNGGTGYDTLYLTADNSGAEMDFLNFEEVVVVANGAADITITTADVVVAAGQTLIVDGSALVLGDYDGYWWTADTTGDLTFDGDAELDGNFVVTGGDGNDTILTGAGNDTVSAGAGNNTVTTNAGNDTITTGNGNNTVNAGAGNDSITTGSGNDVINGGAGNDVIAAGNGANIIIGDGGQDQMSGGTGVDTYVFAATDAQFGLADTITGFNAGDATGVAPMDLFQTWASVNYLGYFDNATLGLLALQTNVGGIEAVLVDEIDGQYLYIDVNGDDAFNSTDAAIKLVGLTGTLEQTDFVV